jgi:hypothetical protein
VAVDKKDKKYLSNVEKSIVKNNLAIIRWQRAEVESDYLDSRYGPPRPRLTHSFEKNKMDRSSCTLCGKAKCSTMEPATAARQPPTGSKQPKNEASMKVLNTVNLLLAKWTTLNIRNEDGAETATRETNAERAKKPSAETTGNRSFHGRMIPVDVKETTTGEEQHQKERILENDAPLKPWKHI